MLLLFVLDICHVSTLIFQLLWAVLLQHSFSVKAVWIQTLLVLDAFPKTWAGS